MGRNMPGLTLVGYLVLCGMLLAWSSPTWATRGNEARGKKLYLTYCFSCHGKTGKGDGYAGQFQRVRPRDLTNDAYMSTRTDQQIFNAINMGGRAFHGSMVMPAWGETLNAEQIWDLTAYVRTLHRKPPFKGVAERGAALFAQYCWTCHGKTGKGNGPIAVAFHPRPRDLTNHAYMSTRTDYDLYDVINQGGAAVDFSRAMPAWGSVLSTQEMWDLVAYIRQLSKSP